LGDPLCETARMPRARRTAQAVAVRRAQPPAAASRRPTYGAAGRLVRAFIALLRTPRGRDIDALAAELGVSRKTAERYARVLLNDVCGQDGLPLVEMVRRDEGPPMLRLRGGSDGLDSTEFQAASMFFAAAALRSLRGTVLADGADEVWDRFKRNLPARSRRALEHIERKFYYVPFAAKEYAGLDDQLDTLLKAVLRNEVLEIRYRRPDGRTHLHRFSPYTFVLYRDGLYLLGESSRHVRPIHLAVDRIVDVQRTADRYSYPLGYSPAAALEGVPGIWSGPEVTVSLRLTGRAAEQIPERRLHPSQSFTPLRGGATLMRLTVRGWQELAWWILSWGADVEVLEPPDLRTYVKRAVQGAAALYVR
jgi:predicted DNA-binding transcriptional regulator YafY